MIVVVKGFYPSITGLNRESACKAFRCEQLIPVVLTEGLAFLEEEGRVAKKFSAVGACKAFWVKLFTDCVQAVTLYEIEQTRLYYIINHIVQTQALP